MASPVPYAVLPDPPSSLPKWAKALWFLKDSIAGGAYYLGYQFGQEIFGTAATPDDPSAHFWRRWVFHWADSASAELADDQQFSIDLIKYSNGAIDSDWTAQDHTDAAAALTQFATAVASNVNTRMSCTTINAYFMAFNPYSNAKPFADSGPPAFIHPVAIPGGSAGSYPPQPCSTITERTPTRGNWGRLYTPSLGSIAYASSGRLSSTTQNSLVSAYSTLVDTMDGKFYPVVPTTSVNRAQVRTLQQVTAAAVDDVVDSHHRRRHKNKISQVILPAPGP